MRDAVRPDLAARRGRVAEAARGRGPGPAAVLSAERLSQLSGVEPARVAGAVAVTAPEVPPERRVHRRFLPPRAIRLALGGRRGGENPMLAPMRAHDVRDTADALPHGPDREHPR
ncbi:hypothetical protein [Streptomyces goshikiensis]|uniref:hypothetical protein n=1 Tax=Streptomyces goshikiensis TaxID=1942 RepID=UPI003323F802